MQVAVLAFGNGVDVLAGLGLDYRESCNVVVDHVSETGIIDNTGKTVLEMTEEDTLVYRVNNPEEYVEAWRFI